MEMGFESINVSVDLTTLHKTWAILKERKQMVPPVHRKKGILV